MESAYGLEVPQNLAEACDPRWAAEVTHDNKTTVYSYGDAALWRFNVQDC